MNKRCGGKKPILYDGWFNQRNNCIAQPINFDVLLGFPEGPGRPSGHVLRNPARLLHNLVLITRYELVRSLIASSRNLTRQSQGNIIRSMALLF